MSIPRVWQIACGEKGRRYERLFLDHDVMFIGPGRFGAYRPADYNVGPASRHYSSFAIRSIRQFATEVQPGDLVLARSGYSVVAIGVVDSEYFHSGTFDDVLGWDLEHCRRVMWQRHLDRELAALQSDRHLFSERKQIPTFTRVHDAAILDPIRNLLGRTQARTINPLPTDQPEPLSMDSLADALFDKGLGYDVVRHVVSTLQKLRRLLNWYSAELSPGRPTEHEVVAHLVLPLMLALGWSEQLLAIEWRRIDLAAFWGTPTDEAHCQLVCEAKGMGNPLEDAIGQATEYCSRCKLNTCSKILVADGGRFYLYRRDGKGWEREPSGYINLQKIRRRHLLPAGADAVETLVALTPAHIGR